VRSPPPATPTSPPSCASRILEIGYDSSKKGFDGASCGVSVSIGAQSPDIAQGVDTAYEARVEGETDELEQQGAGDQGLMFGFACDETPELMPLPIALAHRLSRRLTQVRKDGSCPYLRPDGKTQVTIEYVDGKPVRLDTVVVSTQHAEDIDLVSLLTPDIAEHVVAPELAGLGIETEGYRLLVNPTGKFVIGGRWATPASPAARSSSTPTAATPGTAAAPSPARTRPRSTARPPTPCAGSPRTVVAAGSGHEQCEVQEAYALVPKAEPVGLSSTRSAPRRRRRRGAAGRDHRGVSTLRPGRDHPRPRPAALRSTARPSAYGHFGRDGSPGRAPTAPSC
jgi:S-adenosylmethionine synthetase